MAAVSPLPVQMWLLQVPVIEVAEGAESQWLVVFLRRKDTIYPWHCCAAHPAVPGGPTVPGNMPAVCTCRLLIHLSAVNATTGYLPTAARRGASARVKHSLVQDAC